MRFPQSVGLDQQQRITTAILHRHHHLDSREKDDFSLITIFGQMPLVLDPLLLLAVLAGSVLLGLAAGAYPAWQAAHVEVLEVLRNE